MMKWDVVNKEQILETPVFEVNRSLMKSRTGLEGDYYTIHPVDWVAVVARHDGKFVLVRQFRHGEGQITTEFPGGIVDPAEDPAVTAARELEEETGYRAGTVTYLGKASTNPAIMENHIHFYLAEDLVQTNVLNLDEDEILTLIEVDEDEVIASFGSGEYTHAYMGTALALLMQHERKK